jgi:hypothetical protein
VASRGFWRGEGWTVLGLCSPFLLLWGKVRCSHLGNTLLVFKRLPEVVLVRQHPARVGFISKPFPQSFSHFLSGLLHIK